ncbi:MAG TPA: squalene/phytoene synthase family protein [Candidatus Acidoferrales bacterium]|nr:squalene/phytoene synthase family protein [Candidatus Acidoferrales bacterium]
MSRPHVSAEAARIRPGEMLRAVSRTFALSIERLPSELRDMVSTAYLLFRVSDCLEDNEFLGADHKAELLRIWARVLSDSMPVSSLTGEIIHLDRGDPEVYVAQHADELLECLHRFPQPIQEIIKSHVNQTSLGMARWQENGPDVRNEEEMDDYMHQVAGRVGYLLTDLFAWYSPVIRERKEKLLPLARHFGLALQTVNIIRGLRKDYERGWVYVPRTFYEPLGLTRDSLFAEENASQVLRIIERLADKADTHLQYGLDYIMDLPKWLHGIRLACMWPLLFAVRTIAVSRNNLDVVMHEAKITRSEVKRIIRDTTLFGWSNSWLKNYYSRLSRLTQGTVGIPSGDEVRAA